MTECSHLSIFVFLITFFALHNLIPSPTFLLHTHSNASFTYYNHHIYSVQLEICVVLATGQLVYTEKDADKINSRSILLILFTHVCMFSVHLSPCSIQFLSLFFTFTHSFLFFSLTTSKNYSTLHWGNNIDY